MLTRPGKSQFKIGQLGLEIGLDLNEMVNRSTIKDSVIA